MFENLQNRLEKAFKSLKGQGRINEVNVADTVKEIRRALIAADVNFKVAKDFTDTILEKAKGQDVIKSVSPGQLLTKIVNDELVVLLGGQKADLQLNASPTVILIAGLQGSGKTTFTGKLGKYLKGLGRNPLFVAGDVYRPAARQQLKVLGQAFLGRGFEVQQHGDTHALHHGEQRMPTCPVRVFADHNLRHHGQTVFCRPVVFGRDTNDAPAAHGFLQLPIESSPQGDRRSPVHAQQRLFDLRVRRQIHFLIRGLGPDRPPIRCRYGDAQTGTTEYSSNGEQQDQKSHALHSEMRGRNRSIGQ
jgi:hypothetical protein